MPPSSCSGCLTEVLAECLHPRGFEGGVEAPAHPPGPSLRSSLPLWMGFTHTEMGRSHHLGSHQHLHFRCYLRLAPPAFSLTPALPPPSSSTSDLKYPPGEGPSSLLLAQRPGAFPFSRCWGPLPRYSFKSSLAAELDTGKSAGPLWPRNRPHPERKAGSARPPAARFPGRLSSGRRGKSHPMCLQLLRCHKRKCHRQRQQKHRFGDPQMSQ